MDKCKSCKDTLYTVERGRRYDGRGLVECDICCESCGITIATYAYGSYFEDEYYESLVDEDEEDEYGEDE